MEPERWKDTAELSDRLAILRGIRAQAIHEIGALMLERGGKLTDPDDVLLCEQWSILSRSAEAEAISIIGVLSEREAQWRRMLSVMEQQRADAREGALKAKQRQEEDRHKRLRQCTNISSGWRCGNWFSRSMDESLCHVHREREEPTPRQPYEGWPTDTSDRLTENPATPKHVPWRKWPSSIEAVQPIVPVRAMCDDDHEHEHLLAETVDRRARALLSWAPWARRARHRSRRYEGFSLRGR